VNKLLASQVEGIWSMALENLVLKALIKGENIHIWVKEDLVLTIPNPHKKPIGVDLLKRILKQADIERDKWITR
jgi:hypothetical protein